MEGYRLRSISPSQFNRFAKLDLVIQCSYSTAAVYDIRPILLTRLCIELWDSGGATAATRVVTGGA